MASTIQVKRSAVADKIPLTGDLALGEIALNTTDGKLFIKKDDGGEAIVEISGDKSQVFTGASAPVSGFKAGDIYIPT
jgi:hypothetical protein